MPRQQQLLLLLSIFCIFTCLHGKRKGQNKDAPPRMRITTQINEAHTPHEQLLIALHNNSYEEIHTLIDTLAPQLVHNNHGFISAAYLVFKQNNFCDARILMQLATLGVALTEPEYTAIQQTDTNLKQNPTISDFLETIYQASAATNKKKARYLFDALFTIKEQLTPRNTHNTIGKLAKTLRTFKDKIEMQHQAEDSKEHRIGYREFLFDYCKRRERQ